MQTEHDIEKINRDNFRSSLEALSRPGETKELTPLFGSGLLAMASVLLYAEVSHFYSGKLDFDLIRALCGSPVHEKKDADYLFFDSLQEEHLHGVKTGSPENPDSNSTLIFSALDESEYSLRVRLSGPGINGSKDITLPAAEEFIAKLAKINESFPMGIDLFIVDRNDKLLGLPRTTQIEVLS